MGYDLSEWFSVQSGVRQGCILPYPLPGRHWLDHNQHHSRHTQRHPVDSVRPAGRSWLAYKLAYKLALKSTNQYNMQAKNQWIHTWNICSGKRQTHAENENINQTTKINMIPFGVLKIHTHTHTLSNFARQVGLSVHTSKTQVMCVNSIPTAAILVNEEPLEFMEDFTSLGSLISKDRGASKYIKAMLGKAKGAFSQLCPIWRSKQ